MRKTIPFKRKKLDDKKVLRRRDIVFMEERTIINWDKKSKTFSRLVEQGKLTEFGLTIESQSRVRVELGVQCRAKSIEGPSRVKGECGDRSNEEEVVDSNLDEEPSEGKEDDPSEPTEENRGR